MSASELRRIASAGNASELRSHIAGIDSDVLSRCLNPSESESSSAPQSPLIVAALGGHVEVCKVLLDAGSSVMAVMGNGANALHACAQNGHVEVGKLLLDRGLPIDSAKYSGATALILAAQQGQLKFCRMLVEKGANVNLTQTNGATALIFAAQDNRVDLARFLLMNQASVNVAIDDGSTPLHMAAYKGHTDMCRLLIARGASVNATKNGGATPLFVAAQEGHVSTCHVLLGNSAITSSVMLGRASPLHISAQKGFDEICRDLLDRGASCNVVMDNGASPLYVAVHSGHFKASKLLIEAGADINSPKSNGMTPLHIAASKGFFELCALILERGGKIDAETLDGETPLHLACHASDLRLCRLLLEYTSNIDCQMLNGATPLTLACAAGDVDMCCLMIARGANVNIPAEQGVTPLMLAASCNSFGCVTALLNANAETAALDNLGRTAEQWARSKNFNELADMISNMAISDDLSPTSNTLNFAQHQAGLSMRSDISGTLTRQARHISMSQNLTPELCVTLFLAAQVRRQESLAQPNSGGNVGVFILLLRSQLAELIVKCHAVRIRLSLSVEDATSFCGADLARDDTPVVSICDMLDSYVMDTGSPSVVAYLKDSRQHSASLEIESASVETEFLVAIDKLAHSFAQTVARTYAPSIGVLSRHGCVTLSAELALRFFLSQRKPQTKRPVSKKESTLAKWVHACIIQPSDRVDVELDSLTRAASAIRSSVENVPDVRWTVCAVLYQTDIETDMGEYWRRTLVERSPFGARRGSSVEAVSMGYTHERL